MTNKELLKATAIKYLEDFDEHNKDTIEILECDIDDLVEQLGYNFGDFDLNPEQEALLHKKVSTLEDKEEVCFYEVNGENLVLTIVDLCEEDENNVTLRDRYSVEAFTVEEFFNKLKEKANVQE